MSDQSNRVKALTHKQFALVVDRAKANRDQIEQLTSWPAVAEHLSTLAGFRVGPHATRDVCSFADISPRVRSGGGVPAEVIDDLREMLAAIARAVEALYREQEMTVPPSLARVLQIVNKEDSD